MHLVDGGGGRECGTTECVFSDGTCQRTSTGWRALASQERQDRFCEGIIFPSFLFFLWFEVVMNFSSSVATDSGFRDVTCQRTSTGWRVLASKERRDRFCESLIFPFFLFFRWFKVVVNFIVS